MARNKDILSLKKTGLSRYISKFDKAVSLVTSTINGLVQINEGIDAEVLEIDSYQKELDATKGGLLEAKAKNEQVIKNFSALLASK